MGRPIRIQHTDEIIHVTNRFLESRFFAAPNHGSTIHADFEAILARAIEAYGLIIFVAVLMSNHYHICLRTPQGNLSLAMRFIQTELAKAINRDRGRTGTVFPNRFKDTVIGNTEEDQLDIMRYIILNPVNARLVKKASHWPGFITKAAWQEESSHVFQVSPMPCFENLEQQRIALRPILEQSMHEAIQGRGRILGASKVRKMAWNRKPVKTKKSPPRTVQDRVKSFNPKEKQRIIDKIRSIEARYKEAVAKWRQALEPRMVSDHFPKRVFAPSSAWALGCFPTLAHQT